jgi:hypothetical protein
MTTNVKLTNHIRDQIINNAMKGAFEKDEKALKSSLVKFADKCYRMNVSAAQEKAARQAPDEFLTLCNVASRILVKNDEGHTKFTEWSMDLSRTVPFPGNGTMIAVKSDAMVEEFRAIDAARTALSEKRYELRESLKRTVYSTGSLKKLLEMWPEVEGFLPDSLSAPKPQLPALPVGDLNDALRAAGVKIGVIVKPKATGGLVAVAA